MTTKLAIIGAGGKGLDLTFSVDLDGAVKVAEAVRANKIKKFVLVSAIKADDRDFWWNGPIRSYYIAKKYADEVIKTMNIDWTILQPGRLLDSESNGKIMDPSKVNAFADSIDVATESEKIGIPRDDVAISIIESLRSANAAKKVIPLISGDIPIAEAIKDIK
ncbi:putative sugar epimerase YhfK [Cyberlindnera fabianii]|uniref:Putative sugar epimerase YhfK n=1 Tax=Cyberlindnera fabianii TaxID=36022 RepID=A0A1V2L946_CYBFA|nr:putative sugar epimerase YhfK [Cyberlindnera fabianii]